jgi:hypothetical protein
VAQFVLGAVGGALIVFEAVVGGGFLDAVLLFLSEVVGQFLEGEFFDGLYILLHDQRIVFVAALTEAKEVAFLVSHCTHLYYDEHQGA